MIPDTALKNAIWRSLGKPLPAGILTDEDMLSLTSLDAHAINVRQLDGLGAAHNLTRLNLSYNQLTSLTLPAGLTSLTTLNLYDNQLTSLTLSAGLTSLTTLNLSGNQLTSLTLPAGLTSLTSLDLSWNQLTSLDLA